MKIEVCCPRCGRGHLVDPRAAGISTAPASCAACGTSLAPARLDPGPAARQETAERTDPSEVSCPRCGHRFSPPPAPRAPVRRQRPKVLVVEDMPFFQEIIREALGEAHEVLLASSVAGALRILEAFAPDVLLLDLTLAAGEDGLELLRALPAKPCPVIILSSAEEEPELYGERWRALRALGADDAVVKGVHAGEVLARKVAELLGGGQGGGAVARRVGNPPPAAGAGSGGLR